MSQDIRGLYCVLGRHFLNVVVTRGISHVPSVPSDVLRVDFLPVVPFVSLRDYLRRRLVLQDFFAAEVADLHRAL